jgi:hypothetical protein
VYPCREKWVTPFGGQMGGSVGGLRLLIGLVSISMMRREATTQASTRPNQIKSCAHGCVRRNGAPDEAPLSGA